MAFPIHHFLKSESIMNLSSRELLIGWGEAKSVSVQELDREKPASQISFWQSKSLGFNNCLCSMLTLRVLCASVFH